MSRRARAGSAVSIIAEAGMNHDGNVGLACRLADAAAEAGADAVKYQMHVAGAETLRNAPNPPYFNGEPRYEYFSRTAFTPAKWQHLKRHCESRGLEFLCSPFSIDAVESLERLGVRRHKVPSGEVTNLPLLERIARTGKPVLLSSGMSSWDELDRAVEVIRRRNRRLTVLQCTSEYPCPEERVGLNVLGELARRYGLPIGLSDHTLTNYAAFAAVTLGAVVVEKHLTLSRRMYGSDAKHSLEPEEFAELSRGIRAVERMLTHPVNKADVRRYRVMKRTFQKSIVAVRDLPRGARITASSVALKKPGTGLPAARWAQVLGKRMVRAVAADTVLTEADVDWKAHA